MSLNVISFAVGPNIVHDIPPQFYPVNLNFPVVSIHYQSESKTSVDPDSSEAS